MSLFTGHSPAGVPSNNQGPEGWFNQLRDATLRRVVGFNLNITRVVDHMAHTSRMMDNFGTVPRIPMPVWRSGQQLAAMGHHNYTYTVTSFLAI